MRTFFDQYFDDLFLKIDSNQAFQPPLDIRETPESYTIHVDVPGVPLDGLDIQIKGGVLTLNGKRNLTAESGYVRTERRAGAFQRSVVLPKGVRADAVEATLSNGVLTVTVPKPVEEASRKVVVKTLQA